VTAHPNEPAELPVLTADILEDEELLAAWVDGVIQAHPIAQARAVEIAEWTAWLRDACEPDVWKLYLELERRSEERWTELGSVLVRYGFARGLPLKSGEVDQ
jgi:hypothetical protein